MTERGVLPAPLFWGVVATALGLGVLAIASIGWLLILFAVLLALLAPLRTEPRSFWPLALGLLLFAAGYLLLAPFTCTEGAVSTSGGEQREFRFCESLAGIRYEGEGAEVPSQVPAFGASLGAGLILAGGLRLALRRKERVHE